MNSAENENFHHVDLAIDSLPICVDRPTCRVGAIRHANPTARATAALTSNGLLDMKPTIRAQDEAVSLLRRSGGQAYIWADTASLLHVSTKEPQGAVGWTQVAYRGVRFNFDKGLEEPRYWLIVFHRFPRPHVRVLWNGGAFGPSGSRITDWEGGAPWTDIDG